MSKKLKRFLSLTLLTSFLLTEIFIPINKVYAQANKSNTSIATMENGQVKIKVVDEKGQSLKGLKFSLYKKGELNSLTQEFTDEDGQAIICGSCLFMAPAGDYEIRLEDSSKYRINPDKSTYGNKSIFDIKINIDKNKRNFIESIEGSEDKDLTISLSKKSELSFIHLNVRDASNSPVEGVEFQILDSSEKAIDDLNFISDKNGLVRGDISSLANGEYSLKLKGNSFKFLTELNKDNFKVLNGQIDTIDDTTFSNPINVRVEENNDSQEPENPDEEDPLEPIEKTDLSFIRLEVHGKNNLPVEGFEFILLDENDKKVNVSNFKSDSQGLIKTDISMLKNGVYKIIPKNNDIGVLAGMNPNTLKITRGQIDQLENSRFKDQIKIIVDTDGKPSDENPPTEKDKLSFLNLQVKSKGAPIQGVKFELIDKDKNPIDSVSLVSDRNGLIKSDISSLKDGAYTIRLKGDSYNLLGGLNQDTFTVLNGKIDFISSGAFGKTVNIFVEKNDDISNPEEPGEENPIEKDDYSCLNLKVENVGDASSLPIEFELLDEKDKPVNSIKLIADSSGMIKTNISSLLDGKYTLKLKSDNYSIQAGLNYDEITIRSGKIETVAFQKLVKIFVVPNKKDEPSDLKSILKVRALDVNKNPIKGVKFQMLDVTMDNSIVYDLNLITDSNGEIINDLKAFHNGEYKLLVNDNKNHELASNKDSYKIIIENGKIKSIDDEPYNGLLTIYFKGQGGASSGEAKILDLTPSIKARLSSFATPMELKVVGEGLTEDNWSYETETYIKNKDIIVEDQKLGIEKINKNTLKLEVPENTNQKHIQYKIKVGILKDGKLTDTKTAVINQNGKIKMIQIEPKSVVLRNSKQIVIDFPKDISMYADDVDELKSYIYISEMNKLDRITLSKDDRVEIDGSKLIISFANDIKISVLNHINIDEGALVTSDNELLRDFKWSISFDSEITGITIDTEIFDYKGGRVNSKILGTNLSKIKKEDLIVKVYKAGQAKATSIKPDITIEDDIIVSYDLPENTGKSSESYYISMDLNKKPVYVKKSIVTVMAKGMAKTDTTISAITLGGNNKIESNEDSTDVTIAVKPTSGELKVIISIYGANLDNVKTEARAIDEYGVIWPVYHCPV